MLGGGAGLDTLNGGAGEDDLRGGDDRDTLEGAQGNDTLRGGGGNDTFRGGGGDDLMHGGLDGAGSDTFDGGPGTDTVTYAFAASGVSVTIETSNNSPDGQPGDGDAVFDNVENVTGSTHDDVLVGDADANLLLGSLGNDTVTGAGGADALRGQEGDDTLDARDGIRDQSVNCGPGTDVVTADLPTSRCSSAHSPPAVASPASSSRPTTALRGGCSATALRVGRDRAASARPVLPAGRAGDLPGNAHAARPGPPRSRARPQRLLRAGRPARAREGLAGGGAPENGPRRDPRARPLEEGPARLQHPADGADRPLVSGCARIDGCPVRASWTHGLPWVVDAPRCPT